MNVVLDFLKQYYRVLIVLLFQLITLIILICKKKVKLYDVLTQVLTLIPDFINIAEDKFNDPTEKYSYVFNRCVEVLCSLTHKSGREIIDEYAGFLDEAIESILSTPQKHK